MKTIDIQITRNDPSFNPAVDIDRAHLRELMAKDTLTEPEYDQYGLYCASIARIILARSDFRGYDEDTKEEMRGEALLDTLKARRKFDGVKYPQLSAAFSYLYRIAFHSFQHVLKKYYRSNQNIIFAASEVDNADCRIYDGDEFDPEFIQYSETNWENIANLLSDITTQDARTSHKPA